MIRTHRQARPLPPLPRDALSISFFRLNRIHNRYRSFKEIKLIRAYQQCQLVFRHSATRVDYAEYTYNTRQRVGGPRTIEIRKRGRGRGVSNHRLLRRVDDRSWNRNKLANVEFKIRRSSSHYKVYKHCHRSMGRRRQDAKNWLLASLRLWLCDTLVCAMCKFQNPVLPSISSRALFRVPTTRRGQEAGI